MNRFLQQAHLFVFVLTLSSLNACSPHPQAAIPQASTHPSAKPSPASPSSKPNPSSQPSTQPSNKPISVNTPAVASPVPVGIQVTKIAGLPFGKEGGSALLFNDQIYLIGGKAAYGDFDTKISLLSHFDLETLSVSNEGDLPADVSLGYFKYAQSNAFVSGNKIYKGANSGTGGRIRRSQVYELTLDEIKHTWTSRLIHSLPIAGAPALLASDTHIYAIGGWEADKADDQGNISDQDTTVMLKFNFASGKSEAFGKLFEPKSCMWAVRDGQSIYLLGGSNMDSNHPQYGQGSADILKVSIETGIVTKIGELPSARSFGEFFACEGGGASALMHQGKILIAGGYSGADSARSAQRHSDVLSIDPQTGSVSKIADLPSPRSGVSLAILKNRVYAIGGNDGISPLLDVLEIKGL